MDFSYQIKMPLVYLADTRIPGRHIKLLSFIVSHEQHAPLSWISQTTMADVCGVSRASISRSLGDLKRWGLIYCNTEFDENLKVTRHYWFAEDPEKVYGPCASLTYEKDYLKAGFRNHCQDYRNLLKNVKAHLKKRKNPKEVQALVLDLSFKVTGAFEALKALIGPGDWEYSL